MNSKNTKAELLAEVKKLENVLRTKTQQLEKARMKLDDCKFEEFKVLFKVSSASELYLTELRNKTTLIRIVVHRYDGFDVYGEHREFKDGNRVILMFENNPQADESAKFNSALFLRKVKVL